MQQLSSRIRFADPNITVSPLKRKLFLFLEVLRCQFPSFCIFFPAFFYFNAPPPTTNHLPVTAEQVPVHGDLSPCGGGQTLETQKGGLSGPGAGGTQKVRRDPAVVKR